MPSIITRTPFKSIKRFFFLQNNYNCLAIWQVDYIMLSCRHAAVSTCLLCHVDFFSLSYQFVYKYFIIISTYLHILSCHIHLSTHIYWSISFSWHRVSLPLGPHPNLEVQLPFLEKNGAHLIRPKAPHMLKWTHKKIYFFIKMWSPSPSCFLQNLQHIFPWMVTCEWKHIKV
jgi:hypothetical protein